MANYNLEDEDERQNPTFDDVDELAPLQQEADTSDMGAASDALASIAPTQPSGGLIPPYEQLRQIQKGQQELGSDKLKKLLNDYQNQKRNIAVLSGGNQIAQAIASGFGGRIGTGEEGIKNLQEQAAAPIESFKQNRALLDDQVKNLKGQADTQLAIEMNDPQSDVSKRAREQVIALASQFDPKNADKYAGKYENLTAAQVQRDPFIKALLRKSQASPAKSQQSDYVDFNSGHPLIFDPVAQNLIDVVTKKPIDSSASIGRAIPYNDAFGNRVVVDLAGNARTVVSSKRNELPSEGKAKEEAVTNFNPDKEQREALDKEKARLDGLGQNINEKISASDRILKALESDSKLAAAVIKTQMPRLAGEVGNLNQSEQEVWQGSQAVLDRLSQYVQTNVGSTLTATNKAEIKKILAPFLSTAVNARKSISDASGNSLEMAYKIPSSYTQKYYGELRKLTPGQEKLIAPAASTTNPSETRRKTSDGKIAIFDTATKKFLRYEDSASGQ